MTGVRLTIVFLALCGSALSGPALAQKAGPVLPGGNSKAPVNIDASKLEYFDKEQKAIYSGGVVARQGDATMRATTLTIFFDKDSTPAEGTATGANQLKRIEAAGPVTIVEKQRVGTGDRGIYERAENKVYLIGNPTLSECGNVVKGDKDSRLIYDLANNRAQVSGRVSSTFIPGGNCGEKATQKPSGRTN
jgi:lipopolysaccharide export system protein LptA